MSLFTRLLQPGPEEVKLPVHQFTAVVAEGERFGYAASITTATIATMFALTPAEEAEALEVVTNYLADATITRPQLHDILLLGESGLYSIDQVKGRLGIATG